MSCNMEDSGIDSEDRQSTSLIDELSPLPNATENVSKGHMEDLEVAFRSGSHNDVMSTSHQKLPSNQSANNQYNRDVSNKLILDAQSPNTCRIFQRKLELKVERAKRNYKQYREDQVKKSQSSSLIPIERLAIPGDVEQKPLVDYKSGHSDDDDVDEVSFFPAKRKDKNSQSKSAELTDTFSLQEMTIDSDLDSDDSGGSQNLELLPPLLKTNWFEKFTSCCPSCFASTS